jgi:hypothetical protein
VQRARGEELAEEPRDAFEAHVRFLQDQRVQVQQARRVAAATLQRRGAGTGGEGCALGRRRGRVVEGESGVDHRELGVVRRGEQRRREEDGGMEGGLLCAV